MNCSRMQLTEKDIKEMAARWLPENRLPRRIRVHTDTTDFFRIEYDDAVILKGHPYLIRHNAKEGRFGIDDEIKFWVKRAIDLKDGSQKIIKLVFYEKFKVTVLHVIPDPEEDFFPNEEEKEKWLQKHAEKIDRILKEHRETLIRGGFKAEFVSTRSELRYCPSMAECILAERDKTQYDTIVVGRQGLSRKEQFLFGSISSKIVNHANNCAVWVIS